MMDYYLGDIIKETGRIAFAGGSALNVKLNQKIIARDEVKELFVQPAAGDAGTAVGAAAIFHKSVAYRWRRWNTSILVLSTATKM